MVPLVSVLERFHCILIFYHKTMRIKLHVTSVQGFSDWLHSWTILLEMAVSVSRASRVTVHRVEFPLCISA